MNVYLPSGKKTWHFALSVSNVGRGGRRQRVVNSFATNRRVAEELLRKTVLLVEAVEAGMPLTAELHKWVEQMNPKLRKRLSALGLLTDQDAGAATLVAEHVDAYLTACRFEGMGEGYEKVKRSQLERLFVQAGVRRLSDLNIERVESGLQWLKNQGRSHRTVNRNRATVVAFANWCVKQGRLPHHRLNHIPRLNEDADRRRVRRAATEEELHNFLASVPAHRRFVYTAALMTGLRRGELKQIERRDIDLNARRLTVRVEVSKAKRADVLPIHDDLVDVIAPMTERLGPADKVFTPVPTIKTFKRDLEEAGIPFKDDNGHQLDFHALRSTFATRLLRQGVPAAVARRLTRHASVKTLEKHYDRLGFDEAAAAMQELPGVGVARGPRNDERRTTHGGQAPRR
ncbi:MAG: site-specific integrase [Planctomycetota bacterium]